jgi:hypothetical protein
MCIGGIGKAAEKLTADMITLSTYERFETQHWIYGVHAHEVGL